MKSFSSSSLLIIFSSTLLLLLPTLVSAHGFVHQIIIDGKSYLGNPPNANQDPSPLRQVADVGPVKGAANPDLMCGLKATTASLNVDANPGSIVSFDWRGGNLAPWPHNTGPMMTYMASCGSTTCDKFDPSQAKWFLIDRIGMFQNGSWAQASLLKGALSTVQIPSNLAPGNYLIRHEIIALHLGVTLNGAEFYPSCAQLIVGGSQTGKPAPSDLVSFPGAYKDTDPGIFDPNVFNPGASYTFPGPPVASFIQSSSSSGGSTTGGNGNSTTGGSDSGSSSGGSTTTSGSSSSSGSGSKSGGSCKLKRKGSASSNSNTSDTSSSSSSSSSSTGGGYKRAIAFHRQRKPRTLSRIMRNVIFGDEGARMTSHSSS